MACIDRLYLNAHVPQPLGGRPGQPVLPSPVRTHAPPPLARQKRAADAEDRVADEHDDDEAMTEVRAQESQMRSLLEQRIIVTASTTRFRL